ncbi:MAG: type III PLP-dependent enzyme [Alphaproteobacteria bacterium]|nr:type III PLP-dependent enzyme [Alphaproteobacteria bacterium]
MTERIFRYLREQQPETPCLVIDLDMVEHNFRRMRELLPAAHIFYAMKANPAAPILTRLAGLGSRFDTASRGEIEIAMATGVSADRISFGNTIKKERDIAWAYQQGVRLFAFDSEAELQKLARVAPGARVFCRVLVDCGGAEWPLSRKFGCSPEMAKDLLRKAKAQGLDAYGVSFHVGSQQTDLEQWDKALGQISQMFFALVEEGVDVRMVNLGGGFPAQYRAEVRGIEAYCEAVTRALVRHFGNRMPEVIIEPGRSMVGDAGVLQTEVVLISRKSANDRKRWVYLDVGKFGGLAETMDESIKYRLRTPRDGTRTGPVIVAGPTCDSADILYEKTDYRLPLSLKVGDRIDILSTGAYTTTYSSVAFNGFQPLKSVCI